MTLLPLGKLWPLLAAGFAALAWVFNNRRQRRAGAAQERARAAVQAAKERAEMDSEATDIERDVRELSDEAALEEAKEWAKD